MVARVDCNPTIKKCPENIYQTMYWNKPPAINTRKPAYLNNEAIPIIIRTNCFISFDLE